MQKAKQAAKHTLRQVLGSEEIEEIVNNKAISNAKAKKNEFKCQEKK